MAEIKQIQVGSTVYDIKDDGAQREIENLSYVALDTFEQVSNKVTSISSSSTDTQYPSAKAVYTAINNAIGVAMAAAY